MPRPRARPPKAKPAAVAASGRRPLHERFRTWTPQHTKAEEQRLMRVSDSSSDEDDGSGGGGGGGGGGLVATPDDSSTAEPRSDSFSFLEALEEGDAAPDAEAAGDKAAASDDRARRHRVRRKQRKAKSLGAAAGGGSVYALDADADAEAEMDRAVENEDEGGGDDQYVVYPARFVVLALFGLMSMANAVAWIAFAPIQSLTEDFYGINVTQVNLMTLVYSVSYIPMTPLVSWVYLRYSLRTGVLLGGCLTALGAWIRVLSVDGLSDGARASGGAFYWLLGGQIVAGVAQPFFNNATSRLSATWFSSRSRGIATTVAAMMNPIGAALGQLIPPFFVERAAPGPGGEPGLVTGMAPMLLVGAALATVPVLLAVFLFQSKPPTPPSRSKEARTSDVRARLQKGRKWEHADLDQNRFSREVGRELRTLRHSKHYRVLLLPYAMGQSLFIAFLSQLERFVRPAGFDEDSAGQYGALAMLAGLFGSFVAGTLMDRTHKIREVLKGSFWGAFLAIAYTLSVLRPGYDYAVGFGFVAIGFFTLPVLPVAMEAAAESTYPVNEDISGGLLNMAGNALSFVTVNLLAYLIDQGPKEFDGIVTPAAYFYFFWSLVQALLILLYRGPYKRWWHDKFTTKRLDELHARREKAARRRRRMYKAARLGLKIPPRRALTAGARAKAGVAPSPVLEQPATPASVSRVVAGAPPLGRSSSASSSSAVRSRSPSPARGRRPKGSSSRAASQEQVPLQPAAFRIDDSDEDDPSVPEVAPVRAAPPPSSSSSPPAKAKQSSSTRGRGRGRRRSGGKRG